MRCSPVFLMNCLMVVAAIISGAVWLGGENTTVRMIMKGNQILYEDSTWMREWAHELRTTNVAHKTVILTGASRGLGRGIAAHLVGAGARLILPLRDIPSDIEAFRNDLRQEAKNLGYTLPAPAHVSPPFVDHNILVLPMDLSDLSSVTRFVWILKELPVVVDVLINNAGLISLSPKTTAQGYEMTMGVNFFGTAHLTLLLDEQKVLAKNAVVVSVGSEEHRSAPALPSNPPFPLPEPFGKENFTLSSLVTAYGQSKLALSAWSYELARRWKGRIVRCVCPGPVVSDIARSAPWPLPEIVSLVMKAFFIPATDAALPVLWLAFSPAAQKEVEVNWHMSRANPGGQNASNPEVGKWIWGELAQARAK